MTPMRTGASKLIVEAVRSARRGAAKIRNLGRLDLSPGVIVGPRLSVARGAHLRAGSNVGIGTNVTAMANVDIGADCLISSFVAFIGDDHPFNDVSALIREQPRRDFANIVLEGDNLVGFGSILLGDITIGRGTVIGAGSLVLNDLPAGVIAVGRPAVPVRRRGEGASVGDLR